MNKKKEKKKSTRGSKGRGSRKSAPSRLAPNKHGTPENPALVMQVPRTLVYPGKC